jgi:predicted glycoside hydrolase/deacetylase ChbG (UPF0249 family)
VSNIRLIVNADDFGFTPDVNDGIIEAHRNGILTATTLMANASAFDHAVALAHKTPTLDIGVHLEFETPLYASFRKQIEKIIAAGIKPTHLDVHRHRHLLPHVLRAVARVARDFNIAWVRRPFDLKPRTNVSKAMHLARPFFAASLRGLKTTDYFTGFQLTGTLNTDTLLEALYHLHPGLTEFMCHPGFHGAALDTAPTRLKQSREIELRALTSPSVKDLIAANNIQLTNYRT